MFFQCVRDAYSDRSGRIWRRSTEKTPPWHWQHMAQIVPGQEYLFILANFQFLWYSKDRKEITAGAMAVMSPRVDSQPSITWRLTLFFASEDRSGHEEGSQQHQGKLKHTLIRNHKVCTSFPARITARIRRQHRPSGNLALNVTLFYHICQP